MGKYAANTQVPVSSSQQELERILKRYGADQTLFFREKGRAVIQFRMRNRVLRFTVEVPPLEAFAEKEGYSAGDYRRLRSEANQQKAWEQEERRRWRVLLLLLKAKLEMVQDEVTDFEHEFLANIVLPDNSTAA